jgi:tetratricopeptide (TPR) repeat protein
MCVRRFGRTRFVWLVAGLMVVAGAVGQQPSPKPSPVEARIDTAQAKLKAGAASSGLYNELAAALLRKGRDTDDPAVYKQAGAAVSHSLQLTPGDYEARKLEVRVLLGEHKFAKALALATELNHRVPDDLTVWASLADVNRALGNYEDAERQAQWAIDLRPGNTLGFEKAAELRELFGDVPGAIEFWEEASRRTSPNDLDEQAWLVTEKARLELAEGHQQQAEELLQQAFRLFPESVFATEALARVREAQGRFAEAAVLFGKRYASVKTARNLYDWAEALEKSGQKSEAAAAFARFETEARSESSRAYNADRELVFFYLRYKPDPAAALAVATKMSAVRHDVATLDAYAWALFSNGKYPDAKTQMDRALAVGVRDPEYAVHATQIAEKAEARQ